MHHARALPLAVLTLAATAALAATSAWAAADPPVSDPLWQLEVRAGYGIALSGSGDEMSRRATPLTITAAAAVALDVDPPLAGYGGLVVETLDRSAAGVVAGIELHPHGSHLRFAGGGIAMVVPSTLWGVTASGGVCGHATFGIAVCADLELTAFAAGDDLPAGRAVTQAQIALGLVFDAL